MKSILVLCEGNHCRSPIAEALFRSSLGPGFRVESAGLNALEGAPADAEAQRVVQVHELDISNHRGRQWSDQIAHEADLILVMNQAQKAACELALPSIRGRVFLLGQWLPEHLQEIPDPYMLGPEAARQAFDLIHQSVDSWLPRVKPSKRPV